MCRVALFNIVIIIKHFVWAAGFEPAVYRFQGEDVGQATLRPDKVL
jgi:hypothetical protein